MAFALNRLGATAIRGTFRVRPRRCAIPIRPATRSFHQSHLRRGDETKPPAAPEAPGTPPATAPQSASEAEAKGPTDEGTAVEATPPEPEGDVAATVQSETIGQESLMNALDSFEIHSGSEEGLAKFQALLDDPPPESAALVNAFKEDFDRAKEQIMKEIEEEEDREVEVPEDELRPKRPREGFMSLGEEDESDGEDETFEGDDITSLGHGELEQHRELREYARIAAWEMPMLSKLAKPFELPTDTPLRFRYTYYMGETHPAAKKVVVEFCTADLPLTPQQRLKLVKLLGPRYNPQKDLVKMSCEMFGVIAQNKRYLGDLVDTLIATAKGEGDVEGAKDSFEDVPVDFRHVKWRKIPEFPEEWKITPERQRHLEERRKQRELAEMRRIEEGRLVEGMGIIQQSLRAPAAQPVPQRVTAGARMIGSARNKDRNPARL